MAEINALKAKQRTHGLVIDVTQREVGLLLFSKLGSEERIYGPGEVLFREREFARSFFFLKKGSLRVEQVLHNRLRSKAIGEGMLVGVSTYPEGGFRLASAYADSTAVVVELGCSEVKKALAAEKEISEYLADLSRREKSELLLAKASALYGGSILGLREQGELVCLHAGKQVEAGPSDHLLVLSGHLALDWRSGEGTRRVFLEPGDFWWCQLYELTAPRLSALTASVLMKVPSELLRELFYGNTHFAAALRMRVRSTRNRIAGAGTQFMEQKKYDFLLERGLSYAEAPPIIDLTRCIRCRSCEEACARRHGWKRIDIDAATKLGILSFPRACRKCEYPSCVTRCRKGAMKREAGGEVLIDAAACVGCGACAKACTYEAVSLVEYADLVSPLGEEPSPGNGKKPKKKASKCDHCFGFSDQACVRECPTGALGRGVPLHYLNSLIKSSS